MCVHRALAVACKKLFCQNIRSREHGQKDGPVFSPLARQRMPKCYVVLIASWLVKLDGLLNAGHPQVLHARMQGTCDQQCADLVFESRFSTPASHVLQISMPYHAGRQVLRSRAPELPERTPSPSHQSEACRVDVLLVSSCQCVPEGGLGLHLLRLSHRGWRERS